MLRHLISMTYFYIYFNQFRNVLECYEETTVRRPTAATHTHTHTHTITHLHTHTHANTHKQRPQTHANARKHSPIAKTGRPAAIPVQQIIERRPKKIIHKFHS